MAVAEAVAMADRGRGDGRDRGHGAGRDKQ
jgi:hypothetical protein